MSQATDLALDRDDREDLVRRLGAAVISCWSELPAGIQEKLLSSTRTVDDPDDADDLDARLRLFVGSHLRRPEHGGQT